MQLGFGASPSRLDSRCERWVNGTAKLCRLQENDLIMSALGPNGAHDDPLKGLGMPVLTRSRRQNNGRVRTWTRNEAEMKRMGTFFLLTIGAGEASRAGLVQDLQMQTSSMLGEYGPGRGSWAAWAWAMSKDLASGSNEIRLGGGEGRKRQMTL
jgi:hypothetical protein